MVKDGVEIKDAGKHDQDLDSHIWGLDCKSTDSMNKVEGEKFPCVITDAGDPDKTEDGGSQCLNGLKTEGQENISLDNEIEDQPNCQRETNESLPVEGSTGELVNNASKNEDRSNTKSIVEEQKVNGPGDVKNEEAEQNALDGGMKVVKLTENGVEGGHPAINMIGEENVENGVEGETTTENALAEINADSGVGEGIPVKNDLEENNAENYVEDGNHVKHVIAETNCENIVEEGENPVKHVTEENSSVEFSVEKGKNSAMTTHNKQYTTDMPSNEAPPSQNPTLDTALLGGDVEMADTSNKVPEVKEGDEEPKEHGNEILLASHVGTVTKQEGDYLSLPIKEEAAVTPSSLVRYMPSKAGDLSGETAKTGFAQDLMSEGDDGTPEDQAAFMNEIESFYRERALDFKPPKFYGQPLNCLKLWRSVIRLGGYDRVTGSKLWRQVGESFHPPKTCTTVSWSFRIFYEKSLLEYERHKTQSGELIHPVAPFHEASGVDTEGNGYQGSGPGKARKDASGRVMQGCYVQRPFGNGEDKNINTMAKREKNVKTLGSLKQKRPNEVEPSINVARIETSKQLATTVADVGPPADWVKVNVRQTKDCFEVYALVPGLLREEVRVQSDPAGRLVITGQPEQVDNPWGITPFKKVISLPLRIDPLQTSAVVSLHGRLFVRVPFEQSNS